VSPGQRRRPGGESQPSPDALGGDSNSIRPTDAGALVPRPEWDVYLRGYCDGCRDGIDLGRKQMDDELATLQREAHRVVIAMAKLDPYQGVQARRRQRLVEAAERHAASAKPWADDELSNALDSYPVEDELCTAVHSSVAAARQALAGLPWPAEGVR